MIEDKLVILFFDFARQIYKIVAEKVVQKLVEADVLFGRREDFAVVLEELAYRRWPTCLSDVLD